MSNINSLTDIHSELKREEEKMIEVAYDMISMVCSRYELCDNCPFRTIEGPCINDTLASVVLKEELW